MSNLLYIIYNIICSLQSIIPFVLETEEEFERFLSLRRDLRDDDVRERLFLSLLGEPCLGVLNRDSST